MASKQDRLLHDVPLFPLPNVVLFPRAILPLHIFEPRYRRMISDALAGDRRIAMALPTCHWSAEASVPEIHDIVCVGRIAACEQLEDGRFNLLLQGELRAKVVAENRMLSYRRAELRAMDELRVFDIDLDRERRLLAEALEASPLSTTTLGSELTKLFAGPVSTADIADILAFNVLEDVCLKQRLLEEADVAKRVREIVRAIRALTPQMVDEPSRFRPGDLN